MTPRFQKCVGYISRGVKSFLDFIKNSNHKKGEIYARTIHGSGL